MTEYLFDSQDFMIPVLAIVKTETKGLWRSDLRKRIDAENPYKKPKAQVHCLHGQATDLRRTFQIKRKTERPISRCHNKKPPICRQGIF